jgi:hypothetical protein
MKFKVSALIVVATLVFQANFAPSAEATSSSVSPAFPVVVLDPESPSEYELGICSSSEQLDCIDSVKVKAPNGNFVAALPQGQPAWTTEIDNRRAIHRLETTVQGLNGAEDFVSQGTVWETQSTGQRFVVTMGVMTPGSFADRPEEYFLGFMGVGVRSSDETPLSLDFLVQVSVRTSWLRPQNLQFNAKSASFSQTPYLSGNLWTFSGSPSTVATYELEKSDNAMANGWMEQADGEDFWLGFNVHHAGSTPETSWWNPRCADQGYTAQAFNSAAAGSPEWDPITESLVFNIFAPHTTVSGAQNTGFFRLWVHEDFADCQWPGNTLVGAERLEAVIVNEDNSVRDTEVTVTNENGIIYLDAPSFHYSIPKFVIREASPGVVPSYSPPSPATLNPPTSPLVTTSGQQQAAEPATTVQPDLPKSEKEEVSPSTDSAGGQAREISPLDPIKSTAPENLGLLVAIGGSAAVLATAISLELIRRRKHLFVRKPAK